LGGKKRTLGEEKNTKKGPFKRRKNNRREKGGVIWREFFLRKGQLFATDGVFGKKRRSEKGRDAVRGKKSQTEGINKRGEGNLGKVPY